LNSEQLKKNEPLLVDAWERFAVYDLNSINQQKSFHHLQVWILILGGTASFLALQKLRARQAEKEGENE